MSDRGLIPDAATEWKSAQIGSCPITILWLWPATDHEPPGRHVPALTKFEGGLKLFHEADDDAVMWLESTATTALAKLNENLKQ